MTLDANGTSLTGVPDGPGVYLWKGPDGEVLYVGKAKSLRKRMRQYVSGQDEREKIPFMMEQVASYDYVVTDNEVESLILEANLIKQFDPPYNVDYRDGKSYPFIALTLSDPFPAIKYTRERHRPGTRYFGPYTDARGARDTIEIVRRVYPICRATCLEWKRLTAKGGEPTGKPCFDFHVGKGPGPCVGAVTPESYAERVGEVSAFLEGKRGGIASDLERRMREAAGELDYERAARLRNSLDAVNSVLAKQKVVSDRPLDMDVIGIEREETIAGVHVFLVREGRVLAGNEFVLDKGFDVPESELIEGFLLRYYGETSYVPKEIIVPALPEEPDVAEEWLSRLRGKRARLSVPQRGEKRALSELACTNARHTLARYKQRTRYDEERLNRALLELESALALSAPPLRIECYDISTLHGRHSVGSMVVFSGGRPDRASYRRFKIRMESEEANDFAMMREVLGRRFARDIADDARFGSRPDLIVVDGGKPQLSAAIAVAEELGVSIPIVSLAKREEELYVPDWDEPITLPTGSSSLYLVKRLRDEAHRFAIEYHRNLRDKAMTASALDDIPGVGPKRRKALLKAFGSFRKLRSASAEEIAAVPGIPVDVAHDIFRFVSPLAATSDSVSEGRTAESD
ncbi:MAG: excinuclease ABC subunit UvrC [Actinobacteria bacterium HGW-Actinobacteria-6]|jgi:excinuclease ABC subunit C|nr:MAG: excinuclease ABC subunit UvrC [Actinobacteria bacterium HGW-Actinobacteria-6]